MTTIEDYKINIGKKVSKQSLTENPKHPQTPKPFKSGRKINTVNGVVDHPILHTPAYTFVEDDSYVECRRCKIIT